MSARKTKTITESEPDPVTAFLRRWIEILGGLAHAQRNLDTWLCAGLGLGRLPPGGSAPNLDALEPWAKCFIIEARQLLAIRAGKESAP